MLEKERGKSATLRIQNWHLAIELKKTYLNNPSNDHRNSTTENSPGHQKGGGGGNQKGLEGNARKSP